MDLHLSGRRAAVAASSSGLGFGVAAALAAEGATVVVNGRDPVRVGQAAVDIGAEGVPGDVSTVEGACAFVRDARDRVGDLDILVTNAGGPPPGTFATIDVDQYAMALELNCMSVVSMCREAVPPMQERGWGRVVAITSIAVREPIANLILSNTARAGATGFLKTLAREVAPDGVTVNSLQPGLHATDRITSLSGGDPSALAADVPARALGDPRDFGSLAAFLCSDRARFVTGAAIPVDGGAFGGLQ